MFYYSGNAVCDQKIVATDAQKHLMRFGDLRV